ncbi:MAG: hypothetical protein A4S09_12435 [Proteobacteria bacterium SG_bin7]|nr:MAG: hypothetical protein A4S09_12435 [Proteobacteria bacterium SG_bin7]
MSLDQKAQESEKLLIYPLPDSNLEKLSERLRGFGYKFIQANSIAEVSKVKSSDPTRLAIIELDPKQENKDAAEFTAAIRKISKVMKIVGVFYGRLNYNPQNMLNLGIDSIYQIPFEEEMLINCIFEFAPIELDNAHLTIDSLSRVNVVELEWSEALPFDLFVCLPHNRKIIQYRQKGQNLDERTLEKFRQHRDYSIYIKKNELATYYSYTAQVLSRLKNDGRLSKIEKEKKLSSEMQKILGNLFSHPSADEREGQEMVENVRKVLTHIEGASTPEKEYSNVLMELAAQNMTNYTHCRNVATYCALFGMALGFHEPEILQMGGFLHDVGMSDMDLKLLLKPWNEMTDAEKEVVKSHTANGAMTIQFKKMKVPERVVKMITQHHERVDGSGYPLGLKGDEIDVFAKICAFADEFDELTSMRFGHKTCTPLEAMRRIAGLDGNPPLSVYEKKVFRPLVVSFLEQFGQEVPEHLKAQEAPTEPTPLAAPEIGTENSEPLRTKETSERSGKVKLVEEKVKFGKVDTAPLFRSENKPLFDAISEGNVDTVQKALKNIEVNSRDDKGMTPIMNAILSGKRDIAKIVLKANADVNIQNHEGSTPLMLAIECGNFEMFNLLLIHAFENSFVPGANQAKSGKTWASNVLDINLTNKNGETALMVAARFGNDQMFEALMDAGANLYIKNSGGSSVQDVAKQNGHDSIVETIVRYEAFINQGSDAFGEESKEPPPEKQSDIDVKIRDKLGQTHLMKFSALGNAEMVKKLIALNSEIDAKDFSGLTALLLATKKGSTKVVQQLLDAGANPNIKDGHGKSSLLHAIEAGNAGVIKPLVLAGCKIDSRYLGATPLMIAAYSGNLEVVKAVVGCGANVTEKDSKGKTASDYAKTRNHTAVAEYLEEQSKNNSAA